MMSCWYILTFLQIGSDLVDSKNVWGYLDLIKTYWNLIWFGGYKYLFREVDTITTNLFSAKLQLTEKEMIFLKNSFLEHSLDILPDQVDKLKALCLLILCM